MPSRSPRLLLLLLGLAGVVVIVRGPLHRATHRLPVSNDDAIPLLMAGRVLEGELTTVLWNQPYNGTLDSYLLAPGLVVASPHSVFRAYEAVSGLLLVAAVAALAACVSGGLAGWVAALLAACGTPYMALMAATGPVPNFLIPLLVAMPLLRGLRALDSRASRLSSVELGGWGLLCGLAIWDSALAVPAFAGVGAGLLAAGVHPRRPALAWLVGLGVGMCPLLLARLTGASASSAVTAIRPRWLWVSGLSDLLRAGSGLFGLDVPLVVDGPERAGLPVALRFCLGLSLAAACLAGAVSRKALPLLGWAGALAVAFALSRRTGGDELRYLFGLVVPVLALAGAGLARVGRRCPAAAVVLALGLLTPWLVGHRKLLEHWRDPTHATRVWQVPPLAPALSILERAGVVSAYASLQFAGRLTLESGGRLVASQAWNERIPGDPLRFRDEVDLDPKVAWVLSPHLSRGMPRAGGFRALLTDMGGHWREDRPGDLFVFRRFVPPYDEARPVPLAAVAIADLDGTALPEAVLDRDIETTWTSAGSITRGSGIRICLTPARRLAAVVLAVDLEQTPLSVPWVCDVDGEVVARGPARYGLQWVGGAPRAGKQALLTVCTWDRLARSVRLIFQGAGPPLSVSEIFLYGPDEPPQPPRGSDAAELALEAARAGDWERAEALYSRAVRLEPERAAYHAALARVRWRAARRRWLDVESLDDGGPALVGVR